MVNKEEENIKEAYKLLRSIVYKDKLATIKFNAQSIYNKFGYLDCVMYYPQVCLACDLDISSLKISIQEKLHEIWIEDHPLMLEIGIIELNNLLEVTRISADESDPHRERIVVSFGRLELNDTMLRELATY